MHGPPAIRPEQIEGGAVQVRRGAKRTGPDDPQCTNAWLRYTVHPHVMRLDHPLPWRFSAPKTCAQGGGVERATTLDGNKQAPRRITYRPNEGAPRKIARDPQMEESRGWVGGGRRKGGAGKRGAPGRARLRRRSRCPPRPWPRSEPASVAGRHAFPLQTPAATPFHALWVSIGRFVLDWEERQDLSCTGE